MKNLTTKDTEKDKDYKNDFSAYIRKKKNHKGTQRRTKVFV
jgi:hypothetical protein